MAIGIVTITSTSTWVPVLLALIGAAFLFYGSLLLIYEARHAHAVVRAEMDFVGRLQEHYAPDQPVQERRGARPLFRMPGGGRPVGP
ncbi:MAG: hypothetical protein ABR599_11170 [Gemmatimonadota bacterium]